MSEVESENDKLNKYRRFLALIIVAFHDSRYSDGDFAGHYRRLRDEYSNNNINRQLGDISSYSLLHSFHFSNGLYNASFPALARLLLLIFDLKYIYGDTNSQLNMFGF
ncbi:hypothetical protein RF11_10657 [Thelohanellus kitauei]|uniref:Uncharacterized protein n=1 Tax=Thelohanellus kitauei TaxID=669202 RepID=A0A0C2J2H8_THEKT|nr:hypothetical protein RF11_10657 [Thelohanellus kitauei]